MRTKESLDEWGADLGGLLGNMLALEFSLRVYLGNEELLNNEKNRGGHSFDNIKVGDVVPENPFTNYDSLGELISRYNSDAKILKTGYQIDPTLTEIRDCFAHGRVVQFGQSAHSTLYKFSRPSKEHTVIVTHCIQLTHTCLSDYAERFYNAFSLVIQAHKQFQ